MLGALACSCVKTREDRMAISFAPVSSKPTKAIISGAIYPHDVPFVVNAYYGGTTQYFAEDRQATYNSTQNLFETTTPEYWPLSGSLTFQAYSPASAGLTIASAGVSIEDYTVQTAGQMTTDLLYATATVADCTVHDPVQLVFDHALAQVVFQVKPADYYPSNSLSLDSLSLGGICSVGDFSSADLWDNLGSEYTYVIRNSSLALTCNEDDEPVTATLGSYLLIPQELGSAAALNVAYTISQTVGGTTYTLENPPVSIPLGGTVTEWEAGKKYIYTLNIGLNLINFTASYAPWDSIDGGFVVE